MIKHEKKELEDTKELTTAKTHQIKETLKELKKSFLTEIISCTEPLIDDSQLFSKLEDLKLKIDLSMTELEVSIETISELEKTRDVYRPVSEKGALFYMDLYDLKAIDPLYQFSIESFIKLFLNAIDSAIQDEIASNRILNIINQLTNDVFEFSCISIYEKHNLLFLFQIACTIDKNTEVLLDSELIFFIQGDLNSEKTSVKNPTTWLSNKCWQDVVKLSTSFERFSNLIEHFNNNNEVWKKVNLMKKSVRLVLCFIIIINY